MIKNAMNKYSQESLITKIKSENVILFTFLVLTSAYVAKWLIEVTAIGLTADGNTLGELSHTLAGAFSAIIFFCFFLSHLHQKKELKKNKEIILSQSQQLRDVLERCEELQAANKLGELEKEKLESTKNSSGLLPNFAFTESSRTISQKYLMKHKVLLLNTGQQAFDCKVKIVPDLPLVSHNVANSWPNGKSHEISWISTELDEEPESICVEILCSNENGKECKKKFHFISNKNGRYEQCR